MPPDRGYHIVDQWTDTKDPRDEMAEMTTIKYLLVALAFSQAQSMARANGLEITIRPHASRILFGDSLYIEVAIVNRAKQPITAPAPHLNLRSFDFKLFNPETELEMTSLVGGGLSGSDPVKYEPGKEITHHWIVFFPALSRLNHPFWDPIKKGQSVYVSGVYQLENRTYVRSNSIEVHIETRDSQEMSALEHWATTAVVDWEKGPQLGDFGLRIKAVNFEQTLQVAESVRRGEIQDLCQLTVQLQNIYKSPPDMQHKRIERLIEWLKTQPDIKRQCLAIRVGSIAEANNMYSTVEAIHAAGVDK